MNLQSAKNVIIHSTKIKEKRLLLLQRTKLFNAYVLSKMCAEGYPAVDVFDMTEATPNQPADASGFDYSVVKPVDIALKRYFETRTSKRCEREKVFKKIKVPDVTSQMETESGSGSGGNEDISSHVQSNGN